MPDAPSSLTTTLQPSTPARKRMSGSVTTYASDDVLGQVVPVVMGRRWIEGTAICDPLRLTSKKQKVSKK